MNNFTIVNVFEIQRINAPCLLLQLLQLNAHLFPRGLRPNIFLHHVRALGDGRLKFAGELAVVGLTTHGWQWSTRTGLLQVDKDGGNSRKSEWWNVMLCRSHWDGKKYHGIASGMEKALELWYVHAYRCIYLLWNHTKTDTNWMWNLKINIVIACT